VLLYHLATGAYSVGASTFVAIRDGHRRGVRRLPADARPDLPRTLAGVIDRAPAPDPAARFSSDDGSVRTSKTSRLFAYWISLSPDGRYVAYRLASHSTRLGV